MKEIWSWLERNSAQLQGLAAVAAILGAVAAIPYFLFKWVQADLVVSVTAEAATMPPSLEQWIEDASLELKMLPVTPEEEVDPYISLRQLQITGPLDPSRVDHLWRATETSRIRIDVSNGTDQIISGARLRLDRAFPLWGVNLIATFLTDEEIDRWQKDVSIELGGSSLVLPELPPLPPNSAVTVVAYGDVADATVSGTVPGSAFRVVRTVRVQDKGLVSLAIRGYRLVLLFLLVILVLILPGIWGGMRLEKAVWKRAHKHITYDLACKEALEGRKESSLSLLKAAVSKGYENYYHMRTDPDLEILRDMDEFKKIVGVKVEES